MANQDVATGATYHHIPDHNIHHITLPTNLRDSMSPTVRTSTIAARAGEGEIRVRVPQDMIQIDQSGGRHTGVRDQVKDKAHRYGVKGEIDDLFTSSKKGLTGAAVGALVGGWAAHKAQEANKRGNGSSNNLITLLGAAAGGIIADVGVSKWETANSKTEEKEEKWEKKFGSEGGRSRRGSRDRGTRRRRDSYSSDEGRYRR
ncbi:hypothetical protein M7I_6538 [Glarea lozoyensis 74030]|uniref:Glycine zipper 2TM domain-containing protein n=1 Tax=Glarea lozoyensis (strain ATCC 74030 / MF5533) TaxID=1104152 RepID=H0EUU9_GLAL7|nr:hypothetical protein M7I_6538 [Glarea lozoyensis 74030]